MSTYSQIYLNFLFFTFIYLFFLLSNGSGLKEGLEAWFSDVAYFTDGEAFYVT